MSGAIFFSGKYGSTAQYADWIADATGLPVHDVNEDRADPSTYDFLVLGSSVQFYKLTIRKWLQKNLEKLEGKPIVLFSVAGAPPGAKLDGWIAASLPVSLQARVDHVALRGRLDHSKVGWWIRLLLRVGAWKNRDASSSKDEREGFDYVDQASIQPVVERVRQLQNEHALEST